MIGWWHAYELSFRDHAPQASGPVTRAAPLRSVMIVPFTAAPGDPALSLAAAELTADVTNALGNSMREVWIASARSAEPFVGKAVDAKAVGREANVRFLVEGDMTPAGERVTLMLRLTDTRDGRHLDSFRKVFDRAQLANSETLVPLVTSATRSLLGHAISQAVTTLGNTASSAQDLVDLAESVSIPDPVARDREKLRLADTAIKLDATLPRAWVARADANIGLFYGDLSSDPARLVADADSASSKALILDGTDAVAW